MSDINPYLVQEVSSASPIQLRWMLIKRACELCTLVDNLWQSGDQASTLQWTLRIRDILGELLQGIQDPSNPVAQNVSDFYVFLLKLLTQAETSQDRDALDTLRELLSIEEETWREVCERFKDAGSEAAHLGSSREILRSDKPIAPPIAQELDNGLSGGFSLEV